MVACVCVVLVVSVMLVVSVVSVVSVGGVGRWCCVFFHSFRTCQPYTGYGAPARQLASYHFGSLVACHMDVGLKNKTLLCSSMKYSLFS